MEKIRGENAIALNSNQLYKLNGEGDRMGG